MNPTTKSRILRALSERPGETAARWLRRAECEIAFARAFATLPGTGDTLGWTAAIDRAQALLDGFDPNGGLWGLSAAVRAAEAEMAAIGAAAKRYTIHCVGHGHIDMNWMWSWPETVATTHDTFASVLSLMEQYPHLTYSQSQASVYALVERYYPEMFAKIQERVKEGRWEVTAVHWVEGDKNLASGESLCRHLLYTRRYFAEKFGLSAADVPVDWEPDTFGHANTVPTILAQAGVRFYYACRTGGGFDHARVGAERPRLFWWSGPDGSRVLVNRESTWYNSYVNIGDNIATPAVEFWRETGLSDWLNIYGIGNHGGGPTRVEIDYYAEMRDWPVYPQVVFGTATRWFEKVEKEILASETGTDADRDTIRVPVLDHELNFEFTGCYTSQSLIKQANRFGENYLEEAETLAALSSRLFGSRAPREQLREAWLSVLFNQFHDILPGSGVRQTREHALGGFQEVGAITGSIKRTAGIALTAGIDTLALLPDTPEAAEEHALHAAGQANTPFVAGAGIGAGDSGYSVASGGGKRFRPVVVYNPCAWVRSEPVTVTLYDTDMDPSRVVARDETGAQHPTLFLDRAEDWGHKKLTLMLMARDIPALGYRTYVFCEGIADVETPGVTAGPNETFETPCLKLTYDRFRGGFKQIIDKRVNEQVNEKSTPFGAWQFVTERERGMTAWVLGEVADRPLDLRSTSYSVVGASRNGGTNVTSGAGIGCRITQRMVVPGTESSVLVRTLIHALEPRIDVTAEIDWREIGGKERGIPGLFVAFETDLAEETVNPRYETPFGSVVRTANAGQEVPSLRYAHVEGNLATRGREKPYGFTLLQDSKYGHSWDDYTMQLRIIRSSFDPDHAPEINKHTVRYSMYFHDTPATPATLTRLGAAWNHPLIVFPANLQPGDGATPPTRSFVSVINDNIVLTALKAPEDGDGLILRLVEYDGIDTEAVVTLDPALTVGLTRAEVTDLMEQPITDASATWDGATLRVPVRAHSFVTVVLR